MSIYILYKLQKYVANICVTYTQMLHLYNTYMDSFMYFPMTQSIKTIFSPLNFEEIYFPIFHKTKILQR